MADHPPESAHPRLPTDTDNGLLLIISGPSGVGKTTITRGVERSIPGSVFSVSYTTRAKTDADVEAVDYHFIDHDEFQQLIDEDAFLEWADVFGKRYGTRKKWVDEQLARGRLVILEIDVEGAKQVKAKMPEAFGMFILPPSEDELSRGQAQVVAGLVYAQDSIMAQANRIGELEVVGLPWELVDKDTAALQATNARAKN